MLTRPKFRTSPPRRGFCCPLQPRIESATFCCQFLGAGPFVRPSDRQRCQRLHTRFDLTRLKPSSRPPTFSRFWVGSNTPQLRSAPSHALPRPSIPSSQLSMRTRRGWHCLSGPNLASFIPLSFCDFTVGTFCHKHWGKRVFYPRGKL